MLTEMEGAVLSEIHHRGHQSAFKVRKAFEASPSTEWSGSSGAVYPAIRRLTARGLVSSEPLPTARRANRLMLTEEGVAALEAWATDADRAIGVGLDPFRLRSGIWAGLPIDRRRQTLERLAAELDREIEAIEAGLAALDQVERPRAGWALRLQRARRSWIDSELDGLVAADDHGPPFPPTTQAGTVAR